MGLMMILLIVFMGSFVFTGAAAPESREKTTAIQKTDMPPAMKLTGSQGMEKVKNEDSAPATEEEEQKIPVAADTSVHYGGGGIWMWWLLLIPAAVGGAVVLFCRIRSKKTPFSVRGAMDKGLGGFMIAAAGCLVVVIVFAVMDAVRYKKVVLLPIEQAPINSNNQPEDVIPDIKLQRVLLNRTFETAEDNFAVGEQIALNGTDPENLFGWKITKAMDETFFGDKSWTDYSVQMDICFTEDCSPSDSNTVKLMARVINNVFYGDRHYSAMLENGNTLTLYYQDTKSTSSANPRLNTVKIGNYLDGEFHNLRMDVLDNHILVYWDGEMVIHYTHTAGNSPLRGRVGLYTANTHVIVDNFTVTKLLDAVGGDDDNTIGSNFD